LERRLGTSGAKAHEFRVHFDAGLEGLLHPRFAAWLEAAPFQGGTRSRGIAIMTWIKTIPMAEADEKLLRAIEGQKGMYPGEYFEPVHPDESGGSTIVGSHTLIPEALYHSFATFGALMSPELPLSRRQHEMITTMVSVTNRCVY
jgi:hypothetical protein